MVVHNQYQKIVPFILFVAVLVFFFKLVQPMITILLSSILLAYISFPLYKKITKKISRQFLAIILTLFVLVIVILIPFAFLTFEVTQQGYIFSSSLSNSIAKGALFGFGCTSSESEVCLLLNQVEKFSLEKLSKFGLDKQLQAVLPALEEKITNFMIRMPVMFGEIVLTLIITYFILKDWEKILKRLEDLIPMRTKTKKRLIGEFGKITHAVVYAQLLVALVQGIIATIGFYIFGVPFPVILGVLTSLCALIPAIGTAIVWVPACLFLILSGYFTHNPFIIAKGIGLLLYSTLIIGIVDRILLVKIINTQTKVSQITILVGVVGGVSMFGIVGIFIGPILLPLIITYFETFKERFK